jgi:hypothetical protein
MDPFKENAWIWCPGPVEDPTRNGAAKLNAILAQGYGNEGPKLGDMPVDINQQTSFQHRWKLGIRAYAKGSKPSYQDSFKTNVPSDCRQDHGPHKSGGPWAPQGSMAMRTIIHCGYVVRIRPNAVLESVTACLRPKLEVCGYQHGSCGVTTSSYGSARGQLHWWLINQVWFYSRLQNQCNDRFRGQYTRCCRGEFVARLAPVL